MSSSVRVRPIPCGTTHHQTIPGHQDLATNHSSAKFYDRIAIVTIYLVVKSRSFFRLIPSVLEQRQRLLHFLDHILLLQSKLLRRFSDTVRLIQDVLPEISSIRTPRPTFPVISPCISCFAETFPSSFTPKSCSTTSASSPSTSSSSALSHM